MQLKIRKRPNGKYYVEDVSPKGMGFRLNHCLYWPDNLVDHVGKPVVIVSTTPTPVGFRFTRNRIAS